MIRVEEYIEAIYELSKKKENIKVKDICNYLNLSPSTVSEMLQKLNDLGYVDYKKYRGAKLTKKGLYLAKKLNERHKILKEFFILIGVSEETAEIDACKIEHIISEETLNKIEEFLKKLKSGKDV
ncbi:metal-dependent transcriptional regulator [Methanocaldococcus sp.]